MMQNRTSAGTLLVAAALLAGCGGTVYDSVPEAADNDSVAAETMADDPMQPGAIDDATGTQIP